MTIAVFILWLACAPEAQQPQQPQPAFTNLQLLPKDISRDELMTVMGGFTRALGVRCSHCHVGAQGAPLSTYKFALDDKPAKRTARVMMEMVRDINARHLPAVAERVDPPVKVECATCHRGAAEPRMLQDVLLLEYRKNGLDALFARYRALRQRYHGSFTYNFNEVPLADVASAISDAGRPDDAVQLHALNVEMNPASAFAKRQYAAALVALAENHVKNGDPRRAIEAYERALTLDPENQRLKEQLARLRGGR